VTHHIRRRFWLESVLAGVSLALFALTLITREWIEALTGFDPDHGSGSLEWGIVAVLLCATIALTVLARSEWRRAVPATG
jgi:hypothetical protein